MIFAPAATMPAPVAPTAPPPIIPIPKEATKGPATGHINVNAAPPRVTRSPPAAPIPEAFA